ncbi:MAG: amino acid ABC transporter substrate-binding protein [Gammaproteobacteria bacterium]|nr:amino acid ABC transporter substrate-binding protein [Gammaproteobacteria bacterium]
MKKIFLVLIYVFFSTQALQADSYTVAKPDSVVMGFLQPPGHPVMEWLTLLYTEAFKRVGVKMTREYHPAKRLSIILNNGEVDGEMGRSYSYNSTPENLVRVPVAHWQAEFVAYKVKKDIQLMSWEDFRNRDLKVECLNGIKLCEKKLPEYIEKSNISIVTRPIQALRKLEAGRTDVFIFTKLGVAHLLSGKEFENTAIHYSGTLHKEAAYAYLHKSHEGMIPLLSDVLIQMEKEGLFLKYKKMGKDISDKATAAKLEGATASAARVTN